MLFIDPKSLINLYFFDKKPNKMKTKNRFLPTIYASRQTVFSVNEIALMFPHLNNVNLSRRLSYYVQTDGLLRLRKGIYAKKNYNFWELANKLYSPSYVSFVTILEKEGLIFQHSSVVYMASYTNREIIIGKNTDKRTIQYHRLKKSILLNKEGLEEQNGVWVASRERAFLDVVYLWGDFFIDNLKPLDWERVFKIQTIYKTKALEKRIKSYYKNYQEEYII